MSQDINQNSYWIDKYKPKKISEIVGNTKSINGIVQWIKDYNTNKNNILQKQKEQGETKKKKTTKVKKEKKVDKEVEKEPTIEVEEKELSKDADINEDYNDIYLNKFSSNKNVPKSSLLITGNHGVGKTNSVHVILQELNYDVQTITFGKIKSNKNINDTIEKVKNNSNIVSLIKGQKKKRIAIVIDELEAITSTTEKNYITSLLKSNDTSWYCPIILISNNQHNKLLSDIKKNSYEIRIWPPYESDMLTVLKKIIIAEKIKLENHAVAHQIVDHAQNDFRRLIFTLQDIKYVYENKCITCDLIEEYCQLSKRKDVDFDLFRATDMLLYNYKTIDDCLRCYETEKVLLPLMMHQNYIKNIKNTIHSFDVINNVSELLSYGDVVENYIYGDQNWDMQEIHGYYTCVAPSYTLCSEINKINKKPISNLEFTADLNKTSIKKINKKNIINANKCLKNMDIYDYIYINKIIRKFIADGTISECIKVLEGYNVKLEHIESLLKIDKIKSSKTNLTSKQKKEFQKHLS